MGVDDPALPLVPDVELGPEDVDEEELKVVEEPESVAGVLDDAGKSLELSTNTVVINTRPSVSPL
jgi:hypothetical protein